MDKELLCKTWAWLFSMPKNQTTLREKRVPKWCPWGTIATNGTLFSKGHSFFLNNHVYETVPLGHWGTEIVLLRVPYYGQSNSVPMGTILVPFFLSEETRFLSPSPSPGYPCSRVLPQASRPAWLLLLMESIINSFPDFQPHKFLAWTFNKVRSEENYIRICSRPGQKFTCAREI